MDVVTKRLHVSGLTPQITSDDLKSRFSSFGDVKALDGLGKLDALGQRRPYVYVTLESTKPQLSKCLNLLSGSTWKGAKLRIGDAKADFSERIRKENDINADESRPPKRRRIARGAHGVHSSSMELVTPTSLRPGWRATPLGRLVRPMRMRPLRPLTLPVISGAQRIAEQKVKKRTGKKASKLLVRARRRRIDPEDWGSEYLKGIMLESGSGVILPEREKGGSKTQDVKMVVSEERSLNASTITAKTQRLQTPPSPPPLPVSPPLTTSPIISHVAPIATQKDPSSPKSAPQIDLTLEATRSLSMLNSLFGSAPMRGEDEADDWGGAESLSDFELEVDSSTRDTRQSGYLDEDIEYVAREVPMKTHKTVEKHTDASDKDVEEEIDPNKLSRPEKSESRDQQPTKVQITKLKDMFAPRAEDAGFSLLGNLDLDLELDDIAPVSTFQPPSFSDGSGSSATHIISSATPSSHHPVFTLDPTRPLFFSPSLVSHPQSSNLFSRPGTLFSGSLDFYRTENAEEIRERWASRKVELTRDWKRRHREAVKSARRRGGIRD